MPMIDTHIRSLKPEASPRKYFDGGGLFLYVPPIGSKLWRMSYRFECKSKLRSFGGYRAVSLKDARARREEAKGLPKVSTRRRIKSRQAGTDRGREGQF